MERETEPRSFSAIIIDAVRARGFTVEKLAAATGISERFLSGLLDESFQSLPPAPYTRGYILKIAEVLGLDGGALWKEYVRDEEGLRRSGRRDLLPQNRFLTPRWLSKRTLGIAVVLIALVGYLLARLPTITGTPPLSIAVPSGATMEVVTSRLTLLGDVDPADELLVNGERVRQDNEGKFEKTVELAPGFNTFEFTVRRFLGKERTEVRQVYYRASTSTTTTTPHATIQENL